MNLIHTLGHKIWASPNTFTSCDTTQPLWNQVKDILLGGSTKDVNARKTIARVAAYIEATALLGAGASGLTLAVTAIAFRSLGIAILGAFTYAVAHDISTMGHNLEKITTDRGLANNLVQRSLAASSVDTFVQTCFQNTWIANTTLKNVVIHELLRVPPKHNVYKIVDAVQPLAR